MALAQVGGAGAGGRLILASGDRLLRESLALALAQEGFRILEFAGAEAALALIEVGTDVDALVVDAGAGAARAAGAPEGAAAGAPEGAAVGAGTPQARLRAARCASPVYLLGAPGETQAAAARWGAVGVIDRGQPIAGLRRTLSRAIRAGALLAEPGAFGAAHRGPLAISAEGSRVSWKGCYLDLGPSERALLSGLVAAPAPGLSTQRAQAILSAAGELEADGSGSGGPGTGVGPGAGGPGTGVGPGAGVGPERVKSLIRRLRKKFREVDPEFDHIVFVPGCGYGWREAAERPSEIVR